MDYYYCFRWGTSKHAPIYERTCGTAQAALAWVGTEPDKRFYTLNCLPKRYFY